MKNTGPGARPVGVKGLKSQVEANLGEAMKQETGLAKNKRESASLQKIIATIEENLLKYDSSWATLASGFQVMLEGIEQAKSQLTKELTKDELSKLDAVVANWNAALEETGIELSKLEADVMDMQSQGVVGAERALSQAEQRFKMYQISSITQRLSSADSKLKKANAVPTDNNAQRAEKYVLLALSEEELKSATIETELATFREYVELPANRQGYEEKLVELGLKLVEAEAKSFDAKVTQQAALENFKMKKSAYAATRKSRAETLAANARLAIG